MEGYMKELQKINKQLLDIYKYYATMINESRFISVNQKDKLTIENFLNNEIIKIKPYSIYLANALTDVIKNLFVVTPPIIQINPFRFGTLGTILNYVSSFDFIANYAKYVKTDWEDVNLALQKLLEDSSVANDRLSYNQVGVLGREIYIMLANKVFNKDIHKSLEGIKIGNCDAKGMLEAFFDYKLQQTEMKDFAKSAVKLAEKVVHIKIKNKQLMNTLVIAVVNLISLVNNIYKNNEN